MADDDEPEVETSPEVLRDLNLGGAFLAPPSGEPYDQEGRYWADARFGRNRDGPERPGTPAPYRGVPAPTPPRPRRPQRPQQGMPPAPAAQRPPLASQRPEPGSYWFSALNSGVPQTATAQRDAATRTAAERAAAKHEAEAKKRDEARKAEFVKNFRRDHRAATDVECDIAWESARRCSTLDLD